MTTIERLDRIPARIASRIKRVGTIPFVVDSDGNSFFAFGVDVTFGELTDFGGHRARNEELADVARRETIEESCKLFTFTNSQLNSSLSVYDSETCIIFVNLTSKRGDPKYGFPYNLQNKFDPNICRTQISDQKIETLTSYWIPASIISHIINLGRTLKFNGRGGKEFHLSKKTLFRDLEKYGNFDSLEWSKVHYSADFSELNLEGIASDKPTGIEYFGAISKLDGNVKFFHPAMYEKVRALLSASGFGERLTGSFVNNLTQTAMSPTVGSRGA